MSADQLTIGQCATLACLLEVSAPKPGNVHRGADFDDVSFTDFLVSAVPVGAAMENAALAGLGTTVLAAVQGTRQLVRSNTYLGTILLLAPLAAVPRPTALEVGVQPLLENLTPEDCRNVYEAIRLAKPGGLGRVSQMDIHDQPPQDLLAAMRLAAERDMVARQYIEGFELVLNTVPQWLCQSRDSGLTLTAAIVHTHVRLMSAYPDSLIARKCGAEVAQHSARLAAATLEAAPPGQPGYFEALSDLDFWLRSDGHRRNPGTTADLVAAGLFVALREQMIELPLV